MFHNSELRQRGGLSDEQAARVRQNYDPATNRNLPVDRMMAVYEFFLANPSSRPADAVSLIPTATDDDLEAIWRDNYLWPTAALRGAPNPGFRARAFHVACVISGIRPSSQSISLIDRWFGIEPKFGGKVTPIFVKKVFDAALFESTWRVRDRDLAPGTGQLSRDFRVATLKVATAFVIGNRSRLRKKRMTMCPSAPYSYTEYEAIYESYINGGRD